MQEPAIDETGHKGDEEQEELQFITDLREKLEGNLERCDHDHQRKVKTVYELHKLIDRREKCFSTMLKLSGNDKNQDKIADKKEETHQIEAFANSVGFKIVDSKGTFGPLHGSVLEPFTAETPPQTEVQS